MKSILVSAYRIAVTAEENSNIQDTGKSQLTTHDAPEPNQPQVSPPPYDTNGLSVTPLAHAPQVRQKSI
jgi:hypothetical protein